VLADVLAHHRRRPIEFTTAATATATVVASVVCDAGTVAAAVASVS
jgi:hypothetical protein